MKVLGPLVDLENPDKLVWPRSFPSLEDRERMRTAFYDAVKGHAETPSDRRTATLDSRSARGAAHHRRA